MKQATHRLSWEKWHCASRKQAGRWTQYNMVFPERTFYRFQFEVARTMTGSCDQHGLVGEHVWNVDRPRPITMIKFVVNPLEASRSQVDLRKGSTVCIKMLHRPHLHRASTFLLGWYCARPWRIFSPSHQNLHILRNTLHDVPAVQADILTFHKLPQQQHGDRRSNSIGRVSL